MDAEKRIGENLAKQFENHNFLPEKIGLEDLGLGLKKFLLSQNFSLENSLGIKKQVPIIYTQQEKFAERKMNWANMVNENGEEISRPFISFSRTNVKKGTAPQKYTIPNKRKFTFVKVPKFDGTLKGFDVYRVPQPVYVDVSYEVRFVSHYMEDVDRFYEMMMERAYSDGQGYLNVNGYYMASKIDEPSEENMVDDVTSERVFNVVFPVIVMGKLIDPTKFEKINTITKISINITEK